MNPCLQILHSNLVLAIEVDGIVVVDSFGLRVVEEGVLLVSSRRPCDNEPFSTEETVKVVPFG